jgi:hypothetical protein
VVEVVNVNVMVAVCPEVRLAKLVAQLTGMLVVVTVFTVSVNVFDVNVVEPFVPDMDITPDVVEFVLGVNLAV